MKFELEQNEDYTVLTLKSERMDTKMAPELKGQIILLSNSSDLGHLIMDLGAVNFADSSGLSALLMAHRLYRDSGRELVLCNLSERVDRLLEISQLKTVFKLAPGLNEAVEMITASDS